MFESIRPPRRPRPRILLLVSIAVHVGALILLVSTALWRVDKLGVDDQPLMVAGGPGAPISDGVEEAAEPERPKKKSGPRRTARVTTQAASAAASEEDGGGDDTGGGDGQGPGDGLGLGLFPCAEGGSCSPILDQANKAPPPRPKVEEETIVVAQLIEGGRIEGNPRIEPPDSVRQAMVRAGQEMVRGNVKMCLDRQGNVRSLRVLRSTGHAEYDQRLLAGMRSWRYRPYRLDSGAAVPVCTVITFIYRVE